MCGICTHPRAPVRGFSRVSPCLCEGIAFDNGGVARRSLVTFFVFWRDLDSRKRS